MKYSTILIAFLFLQWGMAQKRDNYKFGQITQADYDLKIYARDSSANAVYLDERGNTLFSDGSRYIYIRTTYYAKIKIFNKEGFDHANIEIPLYNSSNASETVDKIKAVTHNGTKKIFLNQDNIFKEKVNEHWSVVKFTLPDVQEQSIIEYEYEVESPYTQNFHGWEFQTDIPKVYSEFNALIPGNYIYNRRLIGYLKLSANYSGLKRSCFSVRGINGSADCEDLTYAMEHIPAFIEEDFMTSKNNYLAAIRFELAEHKGFDGVNTKYTQSWKNVDKEFQSERTVGKQLRKIDYLEKKLPPEILEINQSLERAKKVYDYIKDHFSWNEKIRLFNEVNVKSVFDTKIGNSAEINIALINALKAAKIDVSPMLISTRSHGFATKVHPVITDFNYIIAVVTVNEKKYFLDATNKHMPFGMLPTRCLNSYGRVMDFDKDSYWMDIEPKENNKTQLSMSMELSENGNFEGQVQRVYRGYNSLEKWDEVSSLSEDEYLDKLESDSNLLTVSSYERSEEESSEDTFKELLKVKIESELENNILLINPFLISRFKENPFKLQERTYPVDFAYPRKFYYNVQLFIPDSYTVKSMPEEILLKLPNGGGQYLFRISENNGVINMIARLEIQRTYFTPDEYHVIKEFFHQIIKNQNSLITLEKQ